MVKSLPHQLPRSSLPHRETKIEPRIHRKESKAFPGVPETCPRFSASGTCPGRRVGSPETSTPNLLLPIANHAFSKHRRSPSSRCFSSAMDKSSHRRRANSWPELPIHRPSPTPGRGHKALTAAICEIQEATPMPQPALALGSEVRLT